MDIFVLLDVVLVVSGLQGIYSAIRLVERHKRAEEPMSWTQLMLSGGISAVMVIAGLWHFFAV